MKRRLLKGPPGRRLALLVSTVSWLVTGAVPWTLAAPSVPGWLTQAIAVQPPNARELAVTYKGTVIDLTTGEEARFVLVAQTGEQARYTLEDLQGRALGRWAYDRGRGWGYTPEGGLVELSAAGLESWRLLALMLAPNRFSILADQALVLSSSPVHVHREEGLTVKVTLEGDLSLILTLDPDTYQILSVKRTAADGLRATVFVHPELRENELHFAALQTFREGLPQRRYQIDQISYGKLLPRGQFAAPEGESEESQRRP